MAGNHEQHSEVLSQGQRPEFQRLSRENLGRVYLEQRYNPALNPEDLRDANLRNCRDLLSRALQGKFNPADIALILNRLPSILRENDALIFPVLPAQNLEMTKARTIVFFRGSLLYKDFRGEILLSVPLADMVLREERVLETRRGETRAPALRAGSRNRETLQREVQRENQDQERFIGRMFLQHPHLQIRGDTAAPDPLDAESQRTVETALEVVERERGQNIEYYHRLLDEMYYRNEEGYDETAMIDRGIGDMEDDEWRRNWSSFLGGRDILRLFEEPPMNSAALAYPEFLRARDQVLREEIPLQVRNRITGNMEEDLRIFRAWAEDIDRLRQAGYGPRQSETLQYADDIREILRMLEMYKERVERVVYHVNPFLEQHWTVETLRDVIQRGRNDRLYLSDITSELYSERNFSSLRRKLLEKGVRPETLQVLHGDDLLRDYSRLRGILIGIEHLQRYSAEHPADSTEFQRELSRVRQEVRFGWEHRNEVQTMADMLGDYLVYARRLLNLAQELWYNPPHVARETRETGLTRERAREHARLLDSHSSENRFEIVRQNADEYQEFRELVHTLATYPFSEQDKIRIFDEYYRLYREAIENPSFEGGHLLIRNTRFNIGMINGVPYAIMPVAFSPAYRALVFRLSNTAYVERYTSEAAQRNIIEQYRSLAGFRPSEFTLTLASPISLDEHGNFVLRNAAGGSTPLRRNREEHLQGRFLRELRLSLSPSDEHGLSEVRMDGAMGETEIFIDPALSEKLFVVFQGGRIYVSLPRDTEVYITREDIHYPFARAGQPQTTIIMFRANPFDPRYGHGGLENRIGSYLYRYRTDQGFTEWEERENLRASEITGRRERGRFMTKEQFLAYLDQHPEAGRNQIRSPQDLTRLENAERELNSAISLEQSFEFLPNGFGLVLARMIEKLRLDPERLARFRTLMSAQMDMEGNRIGPRVLEKIRELVQETRNLFAESLDEVIEGDPDRADFLNMRENPLMISHALSAIMAESLRDSQGTLNTQRAYEQYLENFGRPFLSAAFRNYFQEHLQEYPWQPTSDEIRQIVDIILRDMRSVSISSPGLSLPVHEGSRVGSLFRHILAASEDPDLRDVSGIMTLICPAPSRDAYGTFSPAHLEYSLVPEDPAHPEAVSWRRVIGRFWLDHLSPFPRPGEHFETIMSRPNGPERMRRILRSPFALSLVRYTPHLVPYVFATEDIEKLTELYRFPHRPLFNNPEDPIYRAAKKFFEFCVHVREAQMAGRNELPIPNSPLTLVIHTRVNMGIYRRAGETDMSALLEERFEIRESPVIEPRTGRAEASGQTSLPESAMGRNEASIQ